MHLGRKFGIPLLCLGAVSCASMMVDKNTHEYPQASKDAFMSSCMSTSGGQEAACSCLLTKVQERYTYGEMEDVEAKLKSNQPSPEFTDFMTKAKDSCVTAGPAPIPSK